MPSVATPKCQHRSCRGSTIPAPALAAALHDPDPSAHRMSCGPSTHHRPACSSRRGAASGVGGAASAPVCDGRAKYDADSSAPPAATTDRWASWSAHIDRWAAHTRSGSGSSTSSCRRRRIVCCLAFHIAMWCWTVMGPYDPRHAGLGWPGRGQLREDGRESVHVDPSGPLAFLEDELSGAPLLEAGREVGELLDDGAHILASPDGGRLTGGVRMSTPGPARLRGEHHRVFVSHRDQLQPPRYRSRSRCGSFEIRSATARSLMPRRPSRVTTWVRPTARDAGAHVPSIAGRPRCLPQFQSNRLPRAAPPGAERGASRTLPGHLGFPERRATSWFVAGISHVACCASAVALGSSQRPCFECSGCRCTRGLPAELGAMGPVSTQGPVAADGEVRA